MTIFLEGDDLFVRNKRRSGSVVVRSTSEGEMTSQAKPDTLPPPDRLIKSHILLSN